MIDFEGYYLVNAEQIEYISVSGEGDTGWYNLNVHLLAGRVLTVRYRTKMARDDGQQKLNRQIEAERRWDAENIQNRLYLIEQAVKGVDKRQLKIWRQLKALLGIEADKKNG